jgi:hypothetical protein
MPAKHPLRYDATGALICKGDVVMVPIGQRTVRGVVKYASRGKRFVSVLVPVNGNGRKSLVETQVRRADVSPLPWLCRRRKAFITLQEVA